MSDWLFFDNHFITRPSKMLIDKMTEEMAAYWRKDTYEKEFVKISELLGNTTYHFSLASSRRDAFAQIFIDHYTHFIRESGQTQILTLENERSEIHAGIDFLTSFDIQAKKISEVVLTPQILLENITPRTGLLSISWAHPYTGIIQPIYELIPICKEKGIRVHLDISVAIGKLYYELADLDVDYLTFDGGLFHLPGSIGGILSKVKMPSVSQCPTFYISSFYLALKNTASQLDHFAMEISRLRDMLEKECAHMGGVVFFQDDERLPNTAVVAFEDIHNEELLDALKQRGVIASNGEGNLHLSISQKNLSFSAISFALSDETTEKEIQQAIEIIRESVHTIRCKLKKRFKVEDAKAKGLRLVVGEAGFKQEGKRVALGLLIDEEDGIIADTEYHVFGDPSLREGAKITCEQLLRKNYMQARRLSADVIEKNISFPIESSYINLLIDAIDEATENCLDIPIEDTYATSEMHEGERTEYPNWEHLSNAQKKGVIEECIDKEIRPYVEMDAGGVEVVKVEENRITIAYSGSCTSCYSATGSTLEAIGNILRHRIYPDLMVIPDLATLQNQ